MKYISLITLLYLFTGCSGKEDYEFNKQNECFVGSKFAPEWICQKNTDNVGSFITEKEIVSFNGSNYSEAKEKATKNGIKKLKEKTLISIENKINDFIKEEKIDFIDNKKIKESALSYLTLNVTQVGSWNTDKEMFFLFGLNERSVNREIKHSFMREIKSKNKAFYDTNKIESKLDRKFKDI